MEDGKPDNPRITLVTLEGAIHQTNYSGTPQKTEFYLNRTKSVPSSWSIIITLLINILQAYCDFSLITGAHSFSLAPLISSITE